MSDEAGELLWDQNAERSVLAVGLVSRVARDLIRNHISGGDFADPVHEAVWETMVSLDRAGAGVDPSSVLSALQVAAGAAQNGTRQSTQRALELLPVLVTYPVFPENAATYAETVRGWAVRRRIFEEATRTRAAVMNPSTDAVGLAASTAARFAALRDSGCAEDAQSLTAGEILLSENDEPDWVIPGYLERRDRLMITGTEGGGKSHLLRQLAIMAAAGLDPFDPGVHVRPMNVLIVDCENSLNQIRRRIRDVVRFAAHYGQGHPEHVNLLCTQRMDLASDRDLARIHREADACQPDLMVIGPLYRLSPKAIQTDDEAAPLLAALDTLRDRGITLLIEAHAGHGVSGRSERDMRPRGSSALLGWPEFGYGMRSVGAGLSKFTPWRGDRDERNWPTMLRHCSDRLRWVPADTPESSQPW